VQLLACALHPLLSLMAYPVCPKPGPGHHQLSFFSGLFAELVGCLLGREERVLQQLLCAHITFQTTGELIYSLGKLGTFLSEPLKLISYRRHELIHLCLGQTATLDREGLLTNVQWGDAHKAIL